jgi:hypothetical protein
VTARDNRQLSGKIMPNCSSVCDRVTTEHTHALILHRLGHEDDRQSLCWDVRVCWKYDQMPAFVMAVMNPIPVVACFLDGGCHLTKLTCNDFNEQLYRAAVRYTS